MPVTINGNGSITGLSVGGLGSGVVNTATLADGAATGAKLSSGALLQVVVAETSTTVTWSSGWTDTGLTANITPQFANSKIIMTVYAHVRLEGEYDHGCGFRFMRDSTAIMTTNASNSWNYFYDGTDGPIHDTRGSQVLSFMDTTHNSTSSLTYKLQFNSMRSDEGNTIQVCNNTSRMSMQLTEIKG